jgi:Mrp family chromosome partitioning ATPase
LRANVYRAGSGGYGQVLLLSSPGQGDGKTTCALSLAAALASDVHSVLLVDANLRTPSVHALLGETREPGLSTLLRGACGLEEVVRSVPLSGENIHIITAGRAACSDLLTKATFAEFLENARARYDYIILDTASVPVEDVLALARLCDLTLTVVRLEQTWRRRALAHVQLMEASTPNHAIVVNGPPSRRDRDSVRGRVLPLFSPGQRRPQSLKAPSLDTAPDQPAESA